MTLDYNSPEYQINFGHEKSGTDWLVVVDGVMGGRSTSESELLENGLLFTGNISLKNNGGFASLKSSYKKTDLSAYSEIEIRYRSKGQAFGIRLMEHESYYMPYLKKILGVTSWEWKTISFPLSEFREYSLNKETGITPTSSSFNNISRLGLIVSNKKEGRFTIEIDYIKFK